MLLLKALTDEIVNDSLREDIIESYLINKRAPEELRIKLKPIESDSNIYKKLINDMSVEKDSNIYKNYITFKDLIAKSVEEGFEYNSGNNVEWLGVDVVNVVVWHLYEAESVYQFLKGVVL